MVNVVFGFLFDQHSFPDESNVHVGQWQEGVLSNIYIILFK